MNFSKAILAGLLGAAVISLVAFVSRAFGFPFGFEMVLGSWVLAEAGYLAWVIGLGIHLAIGGFFGIVYAALFRWLRVTGGGAGVVIAVVHLMIAGFVLAAIPPLHPIVPEGLEPPGYFMSGDGPLGVALFVALHLVFGAVVGATYRRTTYARIGTQRGRFATYP